MGSLMGRIMGFLVIIITIALGPTIYTANSTVSGHANVANMTGMAVIAGFGAFIIIFGLLISGGMMAIMGTAGANRGDMIKTIGSVIIVVVALTFMASIMTYIYTLLQAAWQASDTLGQVGFAVIPIMIYSGILGVAGWAQISTIRKFRKGRRARASSFL